MNIDSDRSSEFDTFEEYKATLRLECDAGEAGAFWWIPDESVPDTVYFQVMNGLLIEQVYTISHRNHDPLSL